MQPTLKACLAYGGAMFGLGFLLGTLRELVIVRTLGVSRQNAEICELPLMLLLLAFVARRTIRHWRLSAGKAFAAGLGAVFLLLVLVVPMVPLSNLLR